MDLNYKVIDVFPTLIHCFDISEFNDVKEHLIDYAYNLKKQQPDSKKLSNRGGWQSSCFTLNDENDLVHDLIMKCITSFPTLKESVNLNVAAWININKQGDYNIKHMHPTSDLSGVLWVKCPDNCGKIEFESPLVFQTFNQVECYTDKLKDEYNVDHTYYFNPKEGRILVFPSHLSHQVYKNESNDDRISISFNIRLSNEKK